MKQSVNLMNCGMKEYVQDEFTIVHRAAGYKMYRIMHYFIDVHGFDVDFYEPPSHKLTLLHVIAKFHTTIFTDEDKSHIKRLIIKSNNLLLKNNFGKTIVSLALSANCKENTDFLRAAI